MSIQMLLIAGGALVLTAGAVARAQPVLAPTPAPPPDASPDAPPPPLAQIRSEKQLAETLAAITQDPAIPVDDPSTRALAQALMVEGVKQLRATAYDQALANFLEAYAKFPSPRILLNIGSTLRDMGRLADAANTYQRYLLDPATGAERVGEVKELLLRLDEQLTILTIRVFPRGSDISIDGGPFTPVGSSLLTRVRPGLHLVRIRRGEHSEEITVNGFEGEHKEVAAALKADVPDPLPPPPDPIDPAKPPAAKPPAKEHVELWLGTGRQYATDDANGNQRTVRAGFTGPTIAPIIPTYEPTDDGAALRPQPGTSISSGALAVVRIDGKGRGFAGGLGLAIAFGRAEADLLVLRAETTGGYLGARYRLLTGTFRPYLAAGMPGFVYDAVDPMTSTTATKLAIGVRGAGGLEVVINGHLSVQADLGYERFFGLADTAYESGVFVHTLGVIGRL